MCKWLSGRDLCTVCGQAPPAAHDLPLAECDLDLIALLPPLPEPLQLPPFSGGAPCVPLEIQKATLKGKVSLSLLNLDPPLLKSLREVQGLGRAAALEQQEVVTCPPSPVDLSPSPEGVFLFEEGEFCFH